MENAFRRIEPAEIRNNPFHVIDKEWMLLTAGTLDRHNMMTASWGSFGTLWGRPVCHCYVRPHRYTYGFMEQSEIFTLTFFEEKDRKALVLCGTKSGRDMDKTAAAGFTAIQSETGGIYFKEARLVVECRKIFYQDLDPAHFVDPTIHDNYPDKDYHRMYIGEVINCLVRDQHFIP